MAVPTFCRHNRLEATCPICARKREEGRWPSRAGRRLARRGRPPGRAPSARGGGLKVRHMARAADDGYEHELLPGLRSSVDVGRLADEMAFAAARLEELSTDPPGLYADVAGASDVEEATWLAFLIAYLSPAGGRRSVGGDRAGPHDAGRRASCRCSRTSRWGRAPRTIPRAAHRRCWPIARGPSAPARRRRPSSAIPGGPTSGASTAPSSACRCRASGAPRASSCWSTLGRLGVFEVRPWSLQLSGDALDPTSSPPSACSASAIRCCCSAARATSPPCRRADRGARLGAGELAGAPRTSASPPERRSRARSATPVIGAAPGRIRRVALRRPRTNCSSFLFPALPSRPSSPPSPSLQPPPAPPAPPSPARTGNRRRGW